MKIIFGSAIPFRASLKVGSNYFAEEFSKNGWQVVYLSHPFSQFTLITKRQEFFDKLLIWIKGGMKIGNIWSYQPFCIFPHLNYPIFRSPLLAHIWYKLTIPPVVRTIKRKGFGQVEVIWIDNPLYHFLLDEVKHKKSVIRISDNPEGFKRFFTPEIERIYTNLIRKCDFVFYTSKPLEKYIRNKGRKTGMYYIPNGVDLKRFDGVENSAEPEDIKHIPHPRIIYVGAIDEWFDEEIVEKIAESGMSVIIIGPLNKKIEMKSNIFYLGRKSPDELPSYIFHSDIGIIPFKKNNFTDSINPLKLYEYLACGLPVVATDLEQIKFIKMKYRIGSISISKTYKDFVSNIKKNLKNTAEEKLRGIGKNREILEQNSWENIVKKVMNILDIYPQTSA